MRAGAVSLWLPLLLLISDRRGVFRLNLSRLLFRLILGRRLPVTAGRLALPGLSGTVVIRRDGHGIPHIEAAEDCDAWFGFGFCQGQDRAFQLEALLRAARGTLAEITGEEALPIDRLARRLGFRRAGEGQLTAVAPDVRLILDSFARGVTEGAGHGGRRVAHEHALLRARPTPFEPADVLAIGKLVSFALSANWAEELARLRILTEDGPEALADVNPTYVESHVVTSPPGAFAGPALDRLAGDVMTLKARLGVGGASNNWALSPSRTSTGRALLASDPHLEPVLPNHWYLGHVSTPRWAVGGAALVGTPAISVGHNDAVAWGVTVGMVDDTDLFIEEVSEDGASVRSGDAFVPCEVRRETIAVRGAAPVEETVLVTPRGPIVGSALDVEPWTISLSATWLQPRPVRGLLVAHQARTCQKLRDAMRQWPGPSLNLVFADTSGSIGWQLIGEVPRRRWGFGTLPMSGADPRAGWETDPVAFDDMPYVIDPEVGYVASANNDPVPDGSGPFLGMDWIEGYRITRIVEALSGRADWDADGAAELQLDTQSLPWRELRHAVLAAPAGGDDAPVSRSLLSGWDGRVAADSPAAAVFELFVTELTRRALRARAPKSAEWASTKGGSPLSSVSPLAVRQVGWLTELVWEQPDGWFEGGWPAEIADVLAFVERRLRALRGEDTSEWAWGTVRTLTLRHPLSARKPFDRVFDVGPFACGGDANTVSQASVSPVDPTGNPLFLPTLRMVADVGRWEDARFSLAGGQSGNPCSPHYSDLMGKWLAHEGVPMAWSPEEVNRATVAKLELAPVAAGSV